MGAPLSCASVIIRFVAAWEQARRVDLHHVDHGDFVGPYHGGPTSGGRQRELVI